MIQPTRVLPSNAPPLQDCNTVHQASRVLQEHSGNRQQNEFGFTNDYEQKYPSSALTENSYSRQQQPQQQSLHLYHPQPQNRQPWRYTHARAGHRYPGPAEAARIQIDADHLYRRFRDSNQYMKYRHRQSKDDKGNGDQKWPDHLEKAFFRGRPNAALLGTIHLTDRNVSADPVASHGTPQDTSQGKATW